MRMGRGPGEDLSHCTLSQPPGALILLHRLAAKTWNIERANWLGWVYSVLSVPLFYWNASQTSNFVFFTLLAVYWFMINKRTASAVSLALGLLELYQADFNPRWFSYARRLADDMIARFSDSEAGGFFDTPADARRYFTSLRILMSSCSSSAYFFSAYQRDSQVRLNPSLNPYGWTF